MSMDSADDLEYAEGVVQQMVGTDVLTERQALLDGYCRPSCQAEGPRDACMSDDPSTCGCLCHSGED